MLSSFFLYFSFLQKFELTAAFGETYHLDSVEKLEENLARVLVTSGKKMHQFQVGTM